MMICHGWYPIFEPKKIPASLSHRIVSELLRDEMGFEGLIMTDDLDMGAILNEYARRNDPPRHRRRERSGHDLSSRLRN